MDGEVRTHLAGLVSVSEAAPVEGVTVLVMPIISCI